jgi:2-keto-4-pentenoate hydratase/2-oxohepta-3-ene-1,7-dioic acid hydratase in catechol pathway
LLIRVESVEVLEVPKCEIKVDGVCTTGMADESRCVTAGSPVAAYAIRRAPPVTPAETEIARTLPHFMKPGDTVKISVEKIGELVNPVVAEA